MAYVNNFQHDVFISYAHVDDEGEAWVSQFVKQLECAIKQRLGGRILPEIYFDAKCLNANHPLPELLEAARNSAIFVAVASRAYATRDWTQQELAAFSNTNPDLLRLFAAECLPLSDGDTYPDPLENHTRLPFWRTNEPHSTTPMPLDTVDKTFRAQIHDLAEHISLQLKALKNAQTTVLPPAATDQPTPKANNKCVLLAQVSDDLDDEREQVRRYLQQYHITVLPENTYPQGGAEFKIAFASDLSKADYFVQLLGAKPGKTPPDLPEGYARYQRDQASQSKVKILQWRHPELATDNIQNPDYLDLLTAETVMSSTLESFKAEIVKLSQAPAPIPPPPKLSLNVFINADQEDLTIAKTIQAELSRYPFPVAVPIFEQQNLDENLIDCDVLIWVYGNATRNWVQGQLRYFNKKRPLRSDHPRLLAMCIGLPPDPPEPKPDIGMIFPELQQVDCRTDGFAALHALFGGL